MTNSFEYLIINSNEYIIKPKNPIGIIFSVKTLEDATLLTDALNKVYSK